MSSGMHSSNGSIDSIWESLKRETNSSLPNVNITLDASTEDLETNIRACLSKKRSKKKKRAKRHKAKQITKASHTEKHDGLSKMAEKSASVERHKNTPATQSEHTAESILSWSDNLCTSSCSFLGDSDDEISEEPHQSEAISKAIEQPPETQRLWRVERLVSSLQTDVEKDRIAALESLNEASEVLMSSQPQVAPPLDFSSSVCSSKDNSNP